MTFKFRLGSAADHTTDCILYITKLDTFVGIIIAAGQYNGNNCNDFSNETTAKKTSGQCKEKSESRQDRNSERNRRRREHVSRIVLLYIVYNYISRLLNFGYICNQSKERKNIRPPILNAELDRGWDKMENLMRYFYTVPGNYILWHPIRIASVRRF